MAFNKDGYSVVNFVMDVAMVLSIVVFLNVALRVMPENKLTSRLPSFETPVTKMYEKMYGAETSKSDFSLISQNSARPVRIVIGSEPEDEKRLKASSVPLWIREAIYSKAKGLHLIASSLSVDDIDVADVIRNTAEIKMYTSLSEKPYVAPKGFIHNDAYPYDITLTTVLDIEQLPSINNLNAKWTGPVNVCVFAGPYKSTSSRVIELLRDLTFGKLTVIVVYSEFYGTVFPANFLKNVAISTVFTTHFIEVEPTMLPSRELYSILRNIPISVLYEPINLVVVPTFYSESDNVAASDISSCLQSKKCFIKDRFILKSWFEPNKDKYYMRKLPCVTEASNFYFLRRHNSFDVLYDEHFVTRGFDESSLIEDLRRDGYVFHLLLGGFFVDTSMGRELEDMVMQSRKDVKKLYDTYLDEIAHKKEPVNPSCDASDASKSTVYNDKAFFDIASAMKGTSEKALSSAMYSMKKFDLTKWNSAVQSAEGALREHLKKQ